MKSEQKPQVWLPGQKIPEPSKKSNSYFGWFNHTDNSLVQTGKNFLTGLSSGLSAIPMSFHYAYNVSPSVTKVELRVLATNMLYFGLALGIDYLHDKAWNEPEDQPQSTAKSISELALFILISTPFLINNSIHYLSLQSAVSREKFAHLEKLTCKDADYPNKYEHTCSTQTNPNVALLLSEPLANLEIAIGLVLGKAFIADYGLATRLFHQLAAGTFYANSLIQNRLSMCLEGSRDYVANHFFSVMGYGASMMLLTQLIAMYVYAKTGRESSLIYDAIFSMVYAQFIVHTSFSKLDFTPDAFPLPVFYPVQSLAQDFIDHRKDNLSALLADNQPDHWLKKTATSVINNSFFRHWSTLDLRSLDQALENSSIALYLELTHPTWNAVIDGVSQIPDKTGIHIGKRIEKWGKKVGFKSAQTDLARTLWEISKKGYFSEQFLEPIRNSLNKAAGLPPTNMARVPKNAKPKEIKLEDNDEFMDASEFMIEASHTQRTKTFSHSYSAKEGTGRDGKRTLTATKSSEGGFVTAVKDKRKKQPQIILDDYDGSQAAATTTTTTVSSTPYQPK